MGMGEILGCVCVTLVFLLPVVAVAGWFLKVGGNVLESRALRAWFGKHGADFADGAVPKTHPLFAPIASKLSYEPEPPGHVEPGTLWWAGSGTRDGQDFSFVGHSPSHPQFPNTWRLFMEGHTGLTGDDVLVITATASGVFVDGALAKRTLEYEERRPGWEWAMVQSSGKGEEAEWLTPERGALVQGLLRPGRALHVYPGFVAVVLQGRGSVALIEDALVARDLLLDGPVTDEGPREVESQAAKSVGGSEESLEQALRGKVDWTPAGGGHEWAEVTPHEDGLHWTLRAAPDNLFKWVAAGMLVLFVVIGVLNYLEGEEVSVVGAVVLFGFIGALNGFAWLDGRWDIGWMGVLDLEARGGGRHDGAWVDGELRQTF